MPFFQKLTCRGKQASTYVVACETYILSSSKLLNVSSHGLFPSDVFF